MIAVLEDDADRTAAMRAVLRGAGADGDVVFFDNAPDMIAWLTDNLERVRLLCLDHDLGPNRERAGAVFDPGVGRDVVDVLETRAPCCPVLIHSSNGPAADGMLYALRFAGWTVERVVPRDDLAWIADGWIQRVGALAGGD